MKKEIIAIIKWQYWLYNHGEPKEIIKSVFPDLWEHFSYKFHAYAIKYNNTVMAWSSLFMELSEERQSALIEWVMNNYHGVDSRIKMEGGEQ